MSVIAIYRSSYSRGSEIAQKTASSMGYECVGDEVIKTASREFGVARSKLITALEDAPSFFGMFMETRLKYITYIQCALYGYMMRDNVVYFGPAGHLLVQDVPNVLRVHIISNVLDRVRLKAEKEKTSASDAYVKLVKEDKAHAKWIRSVYKRDDSDPSLYDLEIDLEDLDIDEAVKKIMDTASESRFVTNTYSMHCIRNIELACRVKAALIDIDPNITVRAEGDIVFVHTSVTDSERVKRIARIRSAAANIHDVKTLEIQVTEDIIGQLSIIMR
jgi:cytidylate kinase